MTPSLRYHEIAMASSFLERLKAVPRRPGVYLFRNDRAQVVYVGKAASLRNRMRSYFGAPHSMEAKLRFTRAAPWTTPPQPFNNVRLKDDKHYPYLKVDLTDPVPRVYITRRV